MINEKRVLRTISWIAFIVLLIPLFGTNGIKAVAANNKYRVVFNAEYYSNNNADVVAACGNSEDALLNHFINYGMKEGRQGNSEFNVYSYQAKVVTIDGVDYSFDEEGYTER